MRERKLLEGRKGWVALTCAVILCSLMTPSTAFGDRKRERRVLPKGAAVATHAPTRSAQSVKPSLEAAVERLRSAFDGEASPALARRGDLDAAHIARSRGGYVQSLAAPPGRSFRLSQPSADPTPTGLAFGFLREHREAFGIASPGSSLHSRQVRADGRRSVVRFEQRFAGLKVFGSGAVVQVEESGGIAFVMADLARDDSRLFAPGFPTSPVVDTETAARLARDVLLVEQQVPDLETSTPELMIFEPSVIGSVGPTRLVWHVRVRSATVAVNEVVLVDAEAPEVAFHYSDIRDAKDRVIYDANNTVASPDPPVRTEGDGPTGQPDVDYAYDYLGDTYDFYATLGRDSYDNAGATLVARVRHCDALGLCPDPNAYWDPSALEMHFGDGYAAADDVVGHELTHAVTTSESNLIYWGESGAIDEGLGDIFGELIDLTNTGGTDTPEVRWLIGEDLPIGPIAIRDMSDPTVFGDPDRRFSDFWYTESEDNRGVHVNSGVANKLAFLLVDGGTFNGETVAGQGIPDVAALFYEAQVNLLVPASDYYDLYAALKQAAINLAWSAASREALEGACRAVEIALPETLQTVYQDDFEGSPDGSWEFSDVGGVVCGTNPSCTPAPPPGAHWGPSTHRAASGSSSMYCAAGGPSPAPDGGPYKPYMDGWMVYGPFSLASADNAWAEFDLYLDIEPWFDDIFWGVSTDGVVFDGYAVTPQDSQGCTITCSPSTWVHELFNFNEITSPAIVGATQVWLAFNFTSDEQTEYEGAYIDNVTIMKAQGCALITISPLSLPEAGSDRAYTQTFTQTNGVAPIGWALSGTLPTGMTFDTSTGVLSGTPTQTGDFPITVTATDALGCSGSRSYTLTVSEFVGVALDVDAAGNSVLEPGETASMSPSWLNSSGSSAVLTGALSSFTGPGAPDPAYTIVDGVASYGAVGNGATTACSDATGDCYGLLVSIPTSRPATHWDATVRETLSSGRVKDWTLHVGESFDDVPLGSPFYPYIETLLHHSVTAGCSATGYCPTQSTTRAQMAVFTLRAKEGADYTPPPCGSTPDFGDVSVSSPFCPWIEELARRGVVSGCGGGNYCPDSVVTREQMAVFVLKTLDPTTTPPACASPMFGDMPASSGFCRWVEELARRDVVVGCGGGDYCPTSSVTREQMGVFIGKGFELSLYEP